MAESETEGQARRTRAPTADSGLGWLGWLLVGVIALVLLGVPAVLLGLPGRESVLDSLGLTLGEAYLAIPLVAAMAFGVIAVWAALRARRQ